MRYTATELDAAALADLRADAAAAEDHAKAQQAIGNTARAAELLAYAERCRASVARYSNGGAHRAVMNGDA